MVAGRLPQPRRASRVARAAAGDDAQLPLPAFGAARLAAAPSLTPFMKWPGGKSAELPLIAALAPDLSGRLIDPFVGGGAVLLATPPEVPAWANDACEDLVRVYRAAAEDDATCRAAMVGLAGAWDGLAGAEGLYAELAAAFRDRSAPDPVGPLRAHEARLRAALEPAGGDLATVTLARLRADLPRKFVRMRRVERRAGFALPEADLLANVEGAVRAALYTVVRERYNRARLAGRWDARRTADFLFLREYAYAAMFRFNAAGAFNVPYGGVTYNRKRLGEKVAALFGGPMRARLGATEWRCGDFEPFLREAAPGPDDVVFVDPPYDSDFSAYDGLAFGWADHVRLKRVLDGLTARVVVVIKDTPQVRRLYDDGRWRVRERPKTYMWTIKARNDRSAVHLVATND
jgi:DNA adenine methylase